MAVKRGLSIDLSEIRRNLDQFDDRANRALAGIFAYEAPRATGHMKSTAPWTDRTGNARAGLFALPLRRDTLHILVLSHLMSYGIYLETMQAGKYAVIQPSVRQAADDIWRMIRKLFDLMEGG